MTQINLIPWRQQQREARQKQFFVFMGAACAFSAFLVFVGHFVVGHYESVQQSRNQLLTQEVNQLNTVLQDITRLNDKKNQILARIETIQVLQASRPMVVRIFDQLVDIIPSGVYLTDIKREGKSVFAEGMAESNTRISTLMRNVNASDWLEEAKLSEIKTRNPDFSGGETKAFKLQFNERTYEEEEKVEKAA